MSEQYGTMRGNWKRHICEWFGHDNIGVRNLLYGTPETMCLRCRASSWVVPEWSPFHKADRPDPVEPACYVVEWGPHALHFDTEDEAVAFAREQGAGAVTYRPIWRVRGAN